MKKRNNNDPFVDLVLDEEEKQLETALEKKEFKENPNFLDTKVMLEEASNRHTQLHTAKPITLRVKQLDLIKVKAKAKARNMPYQTLLGTLIHQYAEGETRLEL